MEIRQRHYFELTYDDVAQLNPELLAGYAGRAAVAIREVVDERAIGHYADP